MTQWVGQQGFETLGRGSNPSVYQYFFTSLLRVWIFLDCFFSTPIEINIFRRFLGGALWIKKLIFLGTLFSIIVLFKITTTFLLFFPDCYPRHDIFKHTKAAYAKHRQVWRTPKGPFYENFRLWETKNFAVKSWYPCYAQNLSISEIFWNSWVPPTKFFFTMREKDEKRDTPVELPFCDHQLDGMPTYAISTDFPSRYNSFFSSFLFSSSKSDSKAFYFDKSASSKTFGWYIASDSW